MAEFFEVRTADDVTPEILEIIESIHDGWYGQQPRVDWHDLLERIEAHRIDDGRQIDLGSSMDSEAIMAIKKYVRGLRRR